MRAKYNEDNGGDEGGHTDVPDRSIPDREEAGTCHPNAEVIPELGSLEEGQIQSAKEEARRTFRCFYAVATLKDSAVMDSLVVASLALTATARIESGLAPTCRGSGPGRARADAVRKFLRARFLVRDSETFRNLLLADRTRIATVLFQLNEPRN